MASKDGARLPCHHLTPEDESGDPVPLLPSQDRRCPCPGHAPSEGNAPGGTSEVSGKGLD